MTRERADAAALLTVLKKAKQRTKSLACIERVRRPWTVSDISSSKERWLFLTSPFAAAQVDWKRFAGWNVAALAPRTADVVRAQYLVSLSAARGVEALAKALKQHLVRSRRKKKECVIVYPTSDLGRFEPEQRRAKKILLSLGQLHSPIAYQTRAPAGLAKSLLKCVGVDLKPIFYSPSAVRFFRRAARGMKRKLTLSCVYCLGKSTAVQWNRLKMSTWPSAVEVRDTAMLMQHLEREKP